MKSRMALSLCALLASFSTGCAALSLFGETHTHTHHHHHDCNDAELQKRLERIERQLGSSSGPIVPVPAFENQ